MLGGDAELETFIQALRWAADNLEEMAKNKVSNINDYLCRVEVCFYCKRKPQPD